MDTVAAKPEQIFGRTNDEQLQEDLLNTFSAEHER